MNSVTATAASLPVEPGSQPEETANQSSFDLKWVVERGLATGLAYVLLTSAFAHLSNPYYFLSSVYSYHLVSPKLGEAAAMILPHFQIVLALCLLSKAWLLPAYTWTFLMGLMFVGVQASTLWRGLDISCGCFGVESSQIGAKSLTLAATMALVSLGGCHLASKCSRPGGLNELTPIRIANERLH